MHCSFEVDNYAYIRLEQTACFVKNRDHIISRFADPVRFLNRVTVSQTNLTIISSFFYLSNNSVILLFGTLKCALRQNL